MRATLVPLMLALPLLFMAGTKPAVYGERSDGQAIDIQVGDTFEVALPENPTTGFGWEVTEGLGDVIEQDGVPRYAPDRSNPHMTGGGGIIAFHFKAVAAGTAELKLAYHRKWETETPPAKTFHMTVKVSPESGD